MEFVTQLWAFKSDRFLLGVKCPELLKNHVWLLLILLKTALVGCSVTHLSQPELFADFFAAFGSHSLQDATEAGKSGGQQENNVMKGKSSKASFHFVAACSSDQYLQEQLVWYYYWQGSILLFLMITYLRVLSSGALHGGSSSKSSTEIEDAASAFSGGNPSIEFLNNKIKIRSEDPRKRRDLLILKSWTGALLGLCSVVSALFSLFKLLPAIYRSSCH